MVGLMVTASHNPEEVSPVCLLLDTLLTDLPTLTGQRAQGSRSARRDARGVMGAILHSCSQCYINC